MTNNNTQIVDNYCISPGVFKLDGGAMYGIIPKPLWSKLSPSDEANRIELDLRLWLLTTKDKKILIDTGIGNYHGEKFDKRFAVKQGKNPLQDILVKVGLHPDDITDLVISHLHFDHAGGIGKFENDKLVPVFKNATHHIHKSHYDYALAPSLRDGGSFHPNIFGPILKDLIALDKVHWIDGEQGEILELTKGLNLKFKCSHGHTPFLAHPYTDKFIYLADLIPTSGHVSIPWVMGYDIAPGVTTENKLEFLKFIEQEKLVIIYEHDPKYWGSTIVKNERGQFVVGELFAKSEDGVNKI